MKYESIVAVGTDLQTRLYGATMFSILQITSDPAFEVGEEKCNSVFRQIFELYD
jgi:hypothetical protein